MTETANRSAQTLPKRWELKTEQTWNLENIFPTVGDWETAYRKIESRKDEVESYRGRVGSSAATLLETLRLRDEISREANLIVVYAYLRRAEDATNATSAALADRAGNLGSDIGAAGAFIEPEILAIDPGTLTEYIAAEPGLAAYQQYFDKLGRMRDHVRSAEVEELMAQAANVMDGFSSVRGALENADLDLGRISDSDGNDVQLSQGNLSHYLHDADREVRRAAWTSAADAYLSMKNTFAGTLTGGVKNDVFEMRARRFNSSLEAALYPNAIPTEVFHNLIDTVWKNLPTWHKYFAIRRRILGLDVHHEWDITAPLTTDGPEIPFDEGMQIILESLAPLGEEYVEIVRQGVTDRWVDAYANIGKGGGAFSAGTPGTFPYISMSYQNDFASVSTLTHELGHSLHSYYAWRNQPEVYSHYTMFAAESASNMHQALLGAHLFGQERDRAFQIAMIEERMSNHLRYFFTMPILAKFELDCHERVERGEALTADSMIATLAGIYKEAYGGEVEVDEQRMGITWARFPHLFTNFYVFQYATGISAAAAMGRNVLDEGQPAAERYLNFIKAGDSQFPIDALRAAGVDMRDPAPVQAAFDILAGYVDRLDELTRD